MANKKTWGYIKIDGNKAPGLVIQVVDMEAGDLAFTVLGETTTDAEGKYGVSYQPERYKKFELNVDPTNWMREQKPDIQLRVSVPAPFMNFVTYVLVSEKKSNVSVTNLRFDWNIPKSNLSLTSAGVTELIEKLKDTIPDLRRQRWLDVRGMIQDLFDELQGRIENFLQSEAPAQGLRGAGDAINSAADHAAGTVQNIPVIGGPASDLIKTCGTGLKAVIYFFADRIENLVEFIKQLVLFRPDSEHRIYRSVPVRNRIQGLPQRRDESFNTSRIDQPDEYSDSGVRYTAEIIRRGNRNIAKVTCGNESFEIIKVKLYTAKRKPDPVDAPSIDMIAVDGNRLLVKAEGTDQFFFTTIDEEFPKQVGSQDVPGFYLKLDPEDNQLGRNDEDLQWWARRNVPALPNAGNWDHPGMNGYQFIPYLKDGLKKVLAQVLGPRGSRQLEKITADWGRTINAMSPVTFDYDFLRDFRFFPDVQMIRVTPRVWHELDSRPPYGSGSPPTMNSNIPLYKHITYETVGTSSLLRLEVLLASVFRVLTGIKEDFHSYDFKKVLSIGVSYSHRHTHYEDTYGTEINSGPDHYLVGPILDRGGFWDGTCNFYALVRLKVNKNEAYSYGILWIDEQSYFSERWRLLHPKDNDWGRLREWGMAGSLKRVFSLDTLKSRAILEPVWKRFWCPFGHKCIREHSRMAVAKYIVLLTGMLNRRAAIFSIGYNWGGMDRSWRWRSLPAAADNESEQVTNAVLEKARREQKSVVLTRTIGLRGDMTIHLRGVKVFGNNAIRGRWYQKYLPADNQEVPRGKNLLSRRVPAAGYSHQWRFMDKQSFAVADKYSHFGHYSDEPISFRSQYYPVVEPPPQFGDNDKWKEEPGGGEEIKLYTLAPAFDGMLQEAVYDPVTWLKKSQEEKLAIVKQAPPTMFNDATTLRIVNRGIAGHIAMHWDKRDDDLYPFWIAEGSDTVRVRLRRYVPDDSGGYQRREALYFTLGRQKRKWCPPVVQKVIIKYHAPKIFFTCESRIPYQPKSLVEPFFDDSTDAVRQVIGRYEDRMRRYLNSVDNDPYEHCYRMAGRTAPAYGRAGNVRTDYTIWRMHIWIMRSHQVDRHVVLPVDLSSFVADNTFHLEWDLSLPGQPAYRTIKDHLKEYGMCKYGSTITFEDVTGHIGSPEEVEWLA